MNRELEVHDADCDRVACTLNRGESPADACRRLGWKVGDVVEGDEGYGMTRNIITAIGEREILVKEDESDGREFLITFVCRCWRKVQRR